jgi:hypothetical protein
MKILLIAASLLLVVGVTAQKVKVGDAYLGGVVAYLIQPGEPGYEKKHPHGLLAAKADAGKLVKWQEAINLAKEFRDGGFDDWRIPVKEDLLKLFNNKDLIGGFQVGNYWTSQLSKEDDKGAYLINFYNGYTYTEYMENAVYARFVRKF